MRLLVVHVPQRLLKHALGDGRHLVAEGGGNEKGVHLDELGERMLEDKLGAALEHARDPRLEELVVPGLVALVGRRAKPVREAAQGPHVPAVHHVGVPELVHLGAPRVPLGAELEHEHVAHLDGARVVDLLQVLGDLVEVHPLLRGVLALLPLAHDVGVARACEGSTWCEGWEGCEEGVRVGWHVPKAASVKTSPYALRKASQ